MIQRNAALPSIFAFGLLSLGLAACGGGASGGPPAPIPTVKPTATPMPAPTHSSAPQYTARILWLGAGGGPSTISAARTQQVRRADDSTFATGPIVLVAPDCSNDCLDIYGGGPTQAAVNVSLEVEPSPSSAIDPSFSSNSSDVLLTPQSPAPSAAPIDLAQAVTPGMTGSFTVTGSNASPAVTASQTAYVYPRLNLECVPTATGVAVTGPFGVSFASGATNVAASPASADVYISGPDCPGNFNSSEAGETLHFPYGGVEIGGSTPSDEIAFPSVTTAQWSNTISSFSIPAFTGLSDEPQGIEFKTATGLIVKWYFLSVAPGQATYPTYVSGPFQEQSFSVDGFN